jgi:hypothetical protein
MDKTKINAPLVTRAAEFVSGSVNKDNRTIEITWSAGAVVRRAGLNVGLYNEEMSMDPAHVRMGWLNSGNAPLVDTHKTDSVRNVLGVVERAWLDGQFGRAVVRFSKRADVDGIWQDVQDGIIRNASVGAAPFKVLNTTRKGEAIPSLRLVDWEPKEISLAPWGLDPGAGFRAGGDEYPCEIEFSERSASAPEPDSEAARSGPLVDSLTAIRGRSEFLFNNPL